jgi:putative hemolysin
MVTGATKSGYLIIKLYTDINFKGGTVMKNHDAYKMNISIVTIILIQLLLLIYPSLSEAILNPATVYCNALGYTYVTGGICQLPDGQQVSAQDFVAGKVAQNWSYCAQNGYEVKHIETSECKNCCVCVLQDGREVEVTKLMGLSLQETKCGDGTCGIPENYATCPADCPSGGWDGYCDGVKDGKIDPDCVEGEDPDWVAVIPGDLDKDGDVDQNDVNILLSLRNEPATLCPACDLDGDWMITALDARKLVLLCTRPRCATQ